MSLIIGKVEINMITCTKIMTNEFEVETKVDTKSDTEEGLENAGDRLKPEQKQ